MPLVEGGNWDLILSNLLLPSLLWNFFNVVNKLCKLYYIYIYFLLLPNEKFSKEADTKNNCTPSTHIQGNTY